MITPATNRYNSTTETLTLGGLLKTLGMDDSLSVLLINRFKPRLVYYLAVLWVVMPASGVRY
jgi:hypothetical protein